MTIVRPAENLAETRGKSSSLSLSLSRKNERRKEGRGIKCSTNRRCGFREQFSSVLLGEISVTVRSHSLPLPNSPGLSNIFLSPLIERVA